MSKLVTPFTDSHNDSNNIKIRPKKGKETKVTLELKFFCARLIDSKS